MTSSITGRCVGAIAALAVGCGSSDGAETDSGPPGDAGAGNSDAAGQSDVLEIDCTADNPDCPQVTFTGDSRHNDVFAGFADPSIRRDPNGGRLWMTYSWPRTFGAGQTPVIEIHAAYSDDDGDSWTYSAPLYEPAIITNPVTDSPNFSSNEIMTTWAVDDGGSTTWYAVHLQYLVVPREYIYGQLGAHSFFRVTTAGSVEELPSAPPARLGFGGTDAAYQPHVDLSQLSAELSECTVFMEPAIIVHDGRLYLSAQCWVTRDLQLVHEEFFYALFSTVPDGAPDTWEWQYDGVLFGPPEAQELDGHTFWNQLDLARKDDGTLLAVVSPADTVGGTSDVYHGCRVLAVESLSTPAMARAPGGELDLRARITASDLTEYGPAACAYEPGQSLGVLLTRRLVMDAQLGYRWSIHATGLAP